MTEQTSDSDRLDRLEKLMVDLLERFDHLDRKNGSRRPGADKMVRQPSSDRWPEGKSLSDCRNADDDSPCAHSM